MNLTYDKPLLPVLNAKRNFWMILTFFATSFFITGSREWLNDVIKDENNELLGSILSISDINARMLELTRERLAGENELQVPVVIAHRADFPQP
jgi:hypothetical protein